MISNNAKNELVWHYTSPDGLDGILKNDVLWATSAAFMNDIHELSTGVRALRKHFEKIRPNLSDATAAAVEEEIRKRTANASFAYILSASSDGDSLTLWRNYGKHSVSYAIGLDAKAPLIPLQITDDNEHPHPPSGWGPEYHFDDGGQRHLVVDPDEPVAECLRADDGQWLPVIYKGGRLRQIIEANFDSIVESAGRPKDGRLTLYFHWLSDLLLVKAKGFKDELELRISYTLLPPDWKFLLFRSTPWGVTPYVQLTSAPESYDPQYAYGGSGDDYARVKSKLPIRHIRIGPTPYRRAAKKALRQLLEHHGYSGVEISASKIPYR